MRNDMQVGEELDDQSIETRLIEEHMQLLERYTEKYIQCNLKSRNTDEWHDRYVELDAIRDELRNNLRAMLRGMRVECAHCRAHAAFVENERGL